MKKRKEKDAVAGEITKEKVLLTISEIDNFFLKFNTLLKMQKKGNIFRIINTVYSCSTLYFDCQ